MEQSAMATDFDIAICGGGPVGLTLALLLVKRGFAASRIAVIDAKPVEQAVKDPRSIALSYGSRQILEDIGAWPIAADAIHDIHVSRRGHFGRTIIDREEFGVPALGYVSRYGALVSSLAALLERTAVTSLRPAHVTSSTERADAVDIRFGEGNAITAQFMVQAEGGLFSEQDAKTVRRDYGQTAIIAQVKVSSPVPHRAFERFTEEGPLALLPQEDGYAMVWCVRPETASRLQALSDAEFLSELGNAFGSRLGRFVAVTPRAAYPLGLNAHNVATARTAAIGNAAQTLHPVAGQGLNLGLRDVAVLAKLLSEDLSSASLERFTMHRRTDRNLTIRITDTMARIFASAPDGAPTQAILGLSLGLIDAVKPAKLLLAEHMMFGAR
jgi:2-octaprenyl-6-methoxyphenol hydroxylase